MVNANGLIKSDAHVLVANIQSIVPTKSNAICSQGPISLLLALNVVFFLLSSHAICLGVSVGKCQTLKTDDFCLKQALPVTFSNPASALELEKVNWHTQIILLKITIIPCDIFQLCLGIWAPSASENIRQPRVQRFLIENHNCKMVTYTRLQC